MPIGDDWFDRGDAIEQFHPVRHWFLGRRCRSMRGGPIAHLRVQWFRLRVWWRYEDGRPMWRRTTRCRFGRHDWVPYWHGSACAADGELEPAPDGLLCASCGPTALRFEARVEQAEDAIDNLIERGALRPGDGQPCHWCGANRNVYLEGDWDGASCRLCAVERLFIEWRQTDPERGQGLSGPG